MSLQQIRLLTENGRQVFARKGQLIAFGQQAAQFIVEALLVSGAECDVGDPLESHDGAPGAALVQEIDFSQQQQILDDAKANGHRVQPNHVMFFHCGSCCDPCCALHPSIRQRFTDQADGGRPQSDADPLSANPLSANPLSANPLSANPIRTSAVPSGPQDQRTADESLRDDGPLVYVIDTGLGIDPELGIDSAVGTVVHSWLPRTVTGNRVDVLDVDDDDDVFVDAVAGHGTFIAGIIEWLTPSCRIRVYRPGANGSTGDDGFSSDGDVDEWSVASELRGLQVDPRTIINLSFGGPFYEPDSLLRDEVAAKLRDGAVVVASAGNDASCEPNYPAAFPGVIAVGALDADGRPAAFTNYGSWVDACAIGTDWVSTFLELTPQDSAKAGDPDSDISQFADGWAVWSGTSFAAPAVVATIASMMTPLGSAATAKEAAAAVLAEVNPEVTCLGRRVDLRKDRAQHQPVSINVTS